MANVDGAFGLRLYRDGGMADLETVFIPATDEVATFIGDAVVLAGSAGNITGCPVKATVAQAAAADPIYGVVMGFQKHMVASGADLSTRHRPADTAMYAIVRPAHPLDIYVIQADDVSATLAATSVGQNADIVVGTGNSTTGMSHMELDSDTAATTAGLQLKIVGFLDDVENEVGAVNQKVLVRINQSEVSGDAGTAGV